VNQPINDVSDLVFDWCERILSLGVVEIIKEPALQFSVVVGIWSRGVSQVAVLNEPFNGCCSVEFEDNSFRWGSVSPHSESVEIERMIKST
jgi:hypothetical protein